MENTLIYQGLKYFPYPFIVRHNRTQLYSKYPSADPLPLFRIVAISAGIGYAFGKHFQKPFMTVLFPAPFIANYLFGQYQIKKAGQFQKIYRYENWEVKKEVIELQKNAVNEIQKKQQLANQTQKIRLKKNYSAPKITSVKKYIEKFPNSYFH